MNPRIEIIPVKKLIGVRVKMSLSDDKTPGLWKRLMTRRKEITNNVNHDMISMQIYTDGLNFKKIGRAHV